MTVTSAPIGSSGQSLDGFAVDANVLQAFRESVVITGPNSSSEIVTPVSTQPIGMYGVPVWMLGTPGVTVSGSTQVQVLGTVSTFPTGTTQVSGSVSIQGTSFVNVVSSLPLVLASPISSFVTNQLTTTNVNVISTVPHAIVGTSQVFGTVSTQVVSSIPILVLQSSTPWIVSASALPAVTGQVSSFPTGVASTFAVNQLTTTAVNVLNVSTYPTVSTFATGVTSTFVTNTVNVTGTTSPNIVSSIPFFVAQSSGPWAMYEVATTQTNTNCTSVVLLASLNTTVIKAGPGVITAYQMSNFSSTSVYVKFANASSGVIASTAMYMQRIGIAPSTTIYASQGIGMNFSTGICMFTTRNAWDADLTAPLGSTCVVNLCFR